MKVRGKPVDVQFKAMTVPQSLEMSMLPEEGVYVTRCCSGTMRNPQSTWHDHTRKVFFVGSVSRASTQCSGFGRVSRTILDM